MGQFTTLLEQSFQGARVVKSYNMEEYEKNRATKYINTLKEISRKINEVFVRASPIMEFLTGIMIAILIFISAKF